jgi:hypothetical protein
MLNRGLEFREKFMLFISCLALAFIPAAALSSFGLFEDLEIYYYSFSQIVDTGIIASSIQFYVLTGKFEPVILFIFFIQSLLIPKTAFAFLLINFALLNYGFSILMGKILGNRERYFILYCCVAILSYSYFSREIYIMRTMYACIFLLLLASEPRRSYQVLYLVLGSVTHLSFIAFSSLLMLIKYSYIRLSKIYFTSFWLCVLLLLQILIKSSPLLASFTSTGDMDVFIASNETHSLQSIILLTFTLVVLAISYGSTKTDAEKTLTFFCLFLLVAGLMNFNNYQLMNRVAAPALCIAPFMIMLKSKSFTNNLLKISYLLSVALTIRLLVLFYSGNFAVAT